MTPAEIYRAATEGPGTRTLGFAVDATSRETDREADRATRIVRLASSIRDGWQGEASGGAYGVALPLAMTAEVGAVHLANSQDLLNRQTESFHKLHHEVRPISDPPENPIDEPFPFDVDHEREVTSYQSDAQHNMAVFGAYDDASQYNETNMPREYRTTDRGTVGDVSVRTPADTIEVTDSTGPAAGDPRRFTGPGDTGGGHPNGGPNGGPSPGGHPGSSGDFPTSSGVLPTPGQGQQTSPNDHRPAPPSTFQPSPHQPFPSPAAANPGTTPGPVPFGPGYPGGGAGGSGFGPRGGGTPGGSGGPGVATPRPYGPGAGIGAGALAADEAAARRAAQAATAGPRSGMAPMGAPMGAGRGKDDEDTEHERKVLLESDPEETFGSDVLTAPQVIGDDEYED